MYASPNDNDDRLSAFHIHRDTPTETLKCFIITPSVHYVNPTFANLISQSDTFDDEIFVGTHFFDIDTPPSPPLVLGSPATLESAVPTELIANRLFPTPPGSISDPSTSSSNASPASSFNYSPAGSAAVRYDSSLGALTRRFVDLLRTVPDQSIDLNDAVKQLGVQKRRIYDITNVLEGIGMIRKDGKNSVAWCGDLHVDFNAPQDEQIEKVKRMHEQKVVERRTESKEKKKTRKDLTEAKTHEQKLDSYLRQLGDHVSHYTGESPHGLDPHKYASSSSRLRHNAHPPHPQMYIRYSDLTDHPAYKEDNLIALRAPRGTNIEVPDPDQTRTQGKRSYQMYMSSQSRHRGPNPGQHGAPIDVHLVRPSAESDKGTNDTSATKDQAKESNASLKDPAPPSPIPSASGKRRTGTPTNQTPPQQPATMAARPAAFKDASADRAHYWPHVGNPVSPWVGSPVHGRYQHGHHDFSFGSAASPQRQLRAQYAYSPLHSFASKQSQTGQMKEGQADTPERERQAMGLMNSPLGEVLPSTPAAGTRIEDTFTSTPTFGTQGSSTSSLGDLERSDSPLYELPPLESLPPIYSPHTGSSRMRFSSSPLDWRFPDSSPEKGSSEE